MLSRQSSFVVALVALGSVLGTGTVTAVRAMRPTPAASRSPLGDTLPALTLTTLDGRAVSLRDRVGHRPALIYLFTSAECTGCTDLPLEFRVVRREFPGIEPLLIGSGGPPAAFATSLHDWHLESSALIDANRSILAALRVSSEPLVLLTDSTGRILLVDTRSTSRAAHFPMGEILHGLRAAMTTRSSTQQTSLSPGGK
jgi:peroxiredoxin